MGLVSVQGNSSRSIAFQFQGKTEFSLQIENQPQNILKILADSSAPPHNFIRKVNLGQFLKGQVIRIFSEGRSLVDFGSLKIAVEGAASLRIGQNITARVERLEPAPELKIIASDNRKIAASNPVDVKQEETIQLLSRKNAPISFFSKSNFQFLKLSPGTIYRAEVRQILDPETAAAQIKDRSFLVKTDSSKPLNLGDQIPVVAKKTANGAFHLLQSSGPVVSRVGPGTIKSYLPEGFGEMITKLAAAVGEPSSGSGFAGMGVKEALARLGDILRFMTPQTDQPPNAQRIKDLVDASGMNYESKLKQFLENGLNPEKAGELGRDLKGRLLDVIREMEIQAAKKLFPSAQLQTLKDSIQIFRHAVDNIELHQLTHQLAKQENQSLLLQIPNPFGRGDATLKFYVRPSEDEDAEEKGSGKRDFNLVFLLELSTLGNLRVDGRTSKNRLSIKITVENQSVADFISSQAESFKSRIADMDLAVDLTCCVRENIAPDAEPPKVLMKNEFRLVDLTT